MLCPVAALGQGVRDIYLAPGSHLDIGFTAPPGAVRALRVGVLDDAVRLGAQDSAFHWIEEGGWTFAQWVETHPDDTARLRAARHLLADGQLSIGATWLTPHAAVFADALPLLTAQNAELRRDFGYTPRVAILNDPPAEPEAWVDALVDAGVRYALVGLNPAFSSGFPRELTRTPFWWESPRGRKLLVYIDPDGYAAGLAHWGVDPDCAQAMNPAVFPRGGDPLATMRQGIGAMLAATTTAYDAVIVQQAFDNMDTSCAERLPEHVALWNRSRGVPRLRLGPVEAYFRHIEARYGSTLPVRRGEWGGVWDVVRASTPVWTWRLREAARALLRSPKRDPVAAEALATALDHNLQMGRPRDGFTEEEYARHAEDNEAIFRAAVAPLGANASLLVPPPPEVPAGSPGRGWEGMLAAGLPSARLRLTHAAFPPFALDDGTPYPGSLTVGAAGDTLVARVRLDRTELPDGSVVIEFPLAAPPGRLRLAPSNSPDALAGKWLLGRPPAVIIAPDGARLTGLAHPLRIQSDLVFAWALVPDPVRPEVTWLQGLVVRQAIRCRLADGTVRDLPFAMLHPGEPARLDLGITLIAGR